MKKIYITEEQLRELIDSDLALSTDNTPEYDSSVSTTEPVGDDNYGNPTTSDDKAKTMPPGILQRMTTKGIYGGPMI